MTNSKKQPTLFYSWQSDDQNTRSYIEKALKKALTSVAQNMSIEDAPRLDKDTQGEIGAVSITATIKRKINESKIFAADVSLIDIGKSGKRLTNQNVMFELGYAFGKKSEQAVILIANKDLGDANELPFDIAQNRIIFCSPKSDPKANKLTPVLEYAIKAHLDFVDEASKNNAQEDAKEQLIDAIEKAKPTQTKAEVFFDNIYSRYLDAAPDITPGNELYTKYGERVADSYQKTLPLITEVYEVISVAAEYDDTRTIEVCYKMLGTIAARYDRHNSDEYAALTIQEITSVIVGCLAKHDRWTIIHSLIDTQLTKPKGGIDRYKVEDTYLYPEGIKQYYNQKTGSNYSIPTTPLIQDRFVNNDRILQAYVSGSLVLMFALKFYYSYVSGLLLSGDDEYTPDWISRLHSRVFASEFAKALGLAAVDELRERLDGKRKQKLDDGRRYWNTDITHIFEAEGLMPIIQKVGVK